MRGLLLVALITVCTWASRDPRTSARYHVQQALATIGMKWGDLWLPADFTQRDSHRLRIVDSAFMEPFVAIELVRTLETMVDRLRSTADEITLTTFTQFIHYQMQPYTAAVHMWEYYPPGGLDSTLLRNSIVYQSIVNQYLSRVLAFMHMSDKSRAALRATPTLLAHCDSLWMLSREDENANPHQIWQAQLRGDSIAREYFARASELDFSNVISSGLRLYASITSMVRTTLQIQSLLRDSIRTIEWNTPFGRCAIGGPGDDVYRGDFLFIFDVGGNDTYVLTTTKNQALQRGCSVIVDLAGNDTYLGSDYTLGAGIGGCGILIDCAGNDTYRAGSFSLGCAVWGVGVVHDIAGDDSYTGNVCVQAVATFGISFLLDEGGNDHYSAQAHGQAFAGVRGLAILLDQKGSDVYMTTSPFVDVLRYDSHYVAFTQGAALGYRPIASGGIALLVDRSGNDLYFSDIYGQGTAYWFGIGMVVDHHGEDRYIAYQYTQGAGIHFAHGLLWDHEGDDLYFARGVAQGCGHDVGVGILIDSAGNDSYSVESLSLGGGNANAVSIFVDQSGDDTYTVRNSDNTRGYSDLRRSLPMVGVFVDAHGADRYSSSSGNNLVLFKSTFGIMVDGSDSLEGKTRPSERSQNPVVLPTSLDSLFVLASTAPQKYQYYVVPARNAIVEKGIESLSFLATKLSTIWPRERLALEDILPRLYKTDSVAVERLIADSLRSELLTTIQFCLWAIGKCAMTALQDSLPKYLKHHDWRIRAAAVLQVGEGKFQRLLPYVDTMLYDTHPWVRARAAYALSQVGGMAMRDRLMVSLHDAVAIVRTSSILGLRGTADWNPASLAIILRSTSNDTARLAVAVCLSLLDSTQRTHEGDNSKHRLLYRNQLQQLQNTIMQMPVVVRQACYRSIAGSRMPCTLYWFVSREQQSELQSELMRLLAEGGCAHTESQRRRK